MTPEELEKYIITADVKGLLKNTSGLPESERRKLSKTASALVRALNRLRWEPEKATVQANKFIAKFKAFVSGKKIPNIHKQYRTAELAALAVCPFSVTKRIQANFHWDEHNNVIVDILSSRKPEWINEWINERLKGEWAEIEWESLRYLMKTNMCRKPESDGYIRLMANRLPDNWHNNDEHVPLSEKLRKAPDLLEEDIWRLFEVETMTFCCDWLSPEIKENSNYDACVKSSSPQETS